MNVDPRGDGRSAALHRETAIPVHRVVAEVHESEDAVRDAGVAADGKHATPLHEGFHGAVVSLPQHQAILISLFSLPAVDVRLGHVVNYHRGVVADDIG